MERAPQQPHDSCKLIMKGMSIQLIEAALAVVGIDSNSHERRSQPPRLAHELVCKCRENVNHPSASSNAVLLDQQCHQVL